MKNTLRGALYIVAAMVLYATFGIYLRAFTLPSTVLLFYFALFTGILLGIYVFFKDRKLLVVKKHRTHVFLFGLFITLSSLTFIQAMKLTTIANTVLTHYVAPILVVLLAPFFLKERIEKITWLALSLAVLGLLFITAQGISLSPQHVEGIGYGIASGFAYAGVILTSRYLVQRLKPITIIFYAQIVAVLLMLPFIFPFSIPTTTILFLMIGIAFLYGLVAFLLQLTGYQYVQAQHGAILSYIEPIAAIFFAFLFLSEAPPKLTLLGGALIIGAGLLILRREA